MRKGDLIDRINCWLEKPEDEELMHIMFSAEECNILKTIHDFMVLRKDILKGTYGVDEIKDIDDERVYQRIEMEREISLLLKEQMMSHIDMLLSNGTAEAWLEIMAWYSLLKGESFIIDGFWEFPVLEIMCGIFMEELKNFSLNGTLISVLSLHNMQEVTNAYFKTVFLCRRIEYGIEPEKEIVDYIREWEFSPVFIGSIVQKAKIDDKKKVMDAIESWCWK